MLALSAVVMSPAGTHAGEQDEQGRVRVRIANMENALVQAVKTGAGSLALQIQPFAPPGADVVDSAVVLVNPPEAEGVRLPRRGMIFYVRVPSMNASWLFATTTLSPLRRFAQVPPGQQPKQGSGQLVVPAGQAGSVTAQNVAPGSEVQTAKPVTKWETDVLADPWSAYRRSINDALIDTMLEYGGTLHLNANEFLVVAARRDARPNPLNPNDTVTTLTFSVTGETLDALSQKRITIEEAKKQVEVNED
jgi:hypothetical protein